jgi:PAS domain S-box-containing protein
MLDPEGRVVSWNEGGRRIKGYEADEIIGPLVKPVMPGELMALIDAPRRAS